MTILAGITMTILSVNGKTKVWRYTHYHVDMKHWSQADLIANRPPSDHPDWSGGQTKSLAGAQRCWRNRPRTWLWPTFPPMLRQDVCLPVIWWTNIDCVRPSWTHWVTGQAWRRSGLLVCLIRLKDHKRSDNWLYGLNVLKCMFPQHHRQKRLIMTWYERNSRNKSVTFVWVRYLCSWFKDSILQNVRFPCPLIIKLFKVLYEYYESIKSAQPIFISEH